MELAAAFDRARSRGRDVERHLSEEGPAERVGGRFGDQPRLSGRADILEAQSTVDRDRRVAGRACVEEARNASVRNRKVHRPFDAGALKETSGVEPVGGPAIVSDEESRQAAEWFASLKPRAWTKVTEAAMVPATFVGQGRMRFLQPGGAMEPVGSRIITVPEDQPRARSRDPHSGFIAYVPPGSIAKGKALVETGGGSRTIACGICHGDTLQGLGNVPRLAGVHPIYIARQLYLFKDGTRNGVDAQLMKKPVARLTDDDILNVSAYLASIQK